MTRAVDVHPGRYVDSVRLLQVSREVAELPGVNEAMVAMATELNLGLLPEMGFEPDAVSAAGPDDLLVAVAADDAAALDAARGRVDELLATPASSGGTRAEGDVPPRTIESAARRIGADVALVSVPGRHAFVEAMAALRAGCHVMVFSDNVPIDQEVRLKEEAARRDLLVMGPDCGTAIVGGVGLGFANVVRPGPVGITGSSGTGVQQLCCLLDGADIGVRHAIGTGGRDLSSDVGASSTRRALSALDADPAIEVIVVVSKPPAPEVAERVRAAAAACTTPVVVALLGEPGVTLEATAGAVAARLGRPFAPPAAWTAPPSGPTRRGALRGLFSGGTLRDEAAGIVAADPDPPDHDLVDLGDDEYTRGRAHPMIDPRLRLAQLHAAAADPTTAVVMVDVVLGLGAHPDPAADLAPAVRSATDRGVAVVVSLCGTGDDPQGRNRQAAALREAGASVFLSNAAAARHALDLAKGKEGDTP